MELIEEVWLGAGSRQGVDEIFVLVCDQKDLLECHLLDQ